MPGPAGLRPLVREWTGSGQPSGKPPSFWQKAESHYSNGEEGVEAFIACQKSLPMYKGGRILARQPLSLARAGA